MGVTDAVLEIRFQWLFGKRLMEVLKNFERVGCGQAIIVIRLKIEMLSFRFRKCLDFENLTSSKFRSS